MTKAIQVRLTVKEAGDGQPFLWAESLTASLGQTIRLDLRPGTTLAQAETVARVVNEHLSAIAIG